MVTVIQFLLSLSLLIALHEGGHYIFAKLFKTRVEKFYLFFDFLFPFSGLFNFSLFKKKIGDTEYGLGWFPLGGYVKIAGMIDESMDKEQMSKPPQPWEFRSKPAWQRLLIMLGGIIVNVITAIVIYACILWAFGEQRITMDEINKRGGIQVVDSFAFELGFQHNDKILSVDGQTFPYYTQFFEKLMYGKTVQVERQGQVIDIQLPTDLVGQLVDNKMKGPIVEYSFPPIIGEVVEGSASQKANLQMKDIITAINDVPVNSFMQFRTNLKAYAGQEVTLSIKRADSTIQQTIQVSDSGTIGFRPIGTIKDLEALGLMTTEKYKYSLLEAIPAAVRLSKDKVVSYAQQFKLIFNVETGAYKGMGGFYSMSKIFGNEWDWERFWNVTALLSLILAFMNLLPIPGLDGGYVVFTLFEMLTGKKVSDRVMEVANGVGLILLLFLMIYANGNDIVRNFFMK